MLAVDQLLNAPLCILGFYYAYSLSAALFGAAPHAGAAALLRATNGEVRAKFVETCVKNWQARRAGDRSRNAHPRLSLSLSRTHAAGVGAAAAAQLCAGAAATATGLRKRRGADMECGAERDGE